VADPCSNCPPFIASAAAAPVQEGLSKLQNVKRMTRIINTAVTAVIGDVTADVEAIVDVIPDPPILDLSYMISLYTCPLVPIALAADLSIIQKLDPRQFARQIQAQMKSFITEIISDYKTALDTIEAGPLLRIAQNFLRDFKRLGFDAFFLAEIVVITTAVKAICPEEYENGPYKEFDDAIVGFSLDGWLPNDLNAQVQPLLAQLQRAELKFQAWRAAAAAPILF